MYVPEMMTVFYGVPFVKELESLINNAIPRSIWDCCPDSVVVSSTVPEHLWERKDVSFGILDTSVIDEKNNIFVHEIESPELWRFLRHGGSDALISLENLINSVSKHCPHH